MCDVDTNSLQQPLLASQLPPLTITQSLKILFQSEKSLFLTFFLNFATSLQFYILVTLIPLYFTSEFNFSDTSSGLIFGGFGIVIGILSIYLSSLMKKISFKSGLFFSFIIGIIGFLLLLLENSIVSIVSIILFQSVSCAIAWPYAEYAVKEYSREEIRNLCSSCFFISNYLAGITAGLFIDYMWINLKENSSVYFYSYCIGIIALICAAIILHFCENIEHLEVEDLKNEGMISKRFLKYAFLVFILVLVRSSSFGHLDATLPKYLTRVDAGAAHFGVMLSVHSCTMIFGLITLTALTYYFSSYNLICFGAFLGAISSGFVIYSDSLFAYLMFVIVLSVGESIWVPRLLDYTFAVAPEGNEGVYLAISNCPFYFGMVLTGAESGVMFDKFCDKDSDGSQCYFIWIFLLGSSVLIFSMLVGFKGFILNWRSGGESGEDLELKELKE